MSPINKASPPGFHPLTAAERRQADDHRRCLLKIHGKIDCSWLDHEAVESASRVGLWQAEVRWATGEYQNWGSLVYAVVRGHIVDEQRRQVGRLNSLKCLRHRDQVSLTQLELCSEDSPDSFDPADQAICQAVRDDVRSAVLAAIERLSGTDQELVLLRMHQVGLPQVAARFQRSTSWAANKTAVALDRLKSVIMNEMPELAELLGVTLKTPEPGLDFSGSAGE